MPVGLNSLSLYRHDQQERPLVRSLEKPRAELSMHLNGGANDPVCDQLPMIHACSESMRNAATFLASIWNLMKNRPQLLRSV